MTKNRKLKWFALIALAPGVLLAFVAGLWAFMVLTATPLHPNPQDVPSSTAPTPSPRWADAVAQARQIVREEIAKQNLPGVSVAVGVDEGGHQELVWAEGFGFADLETREPVDPAMRFRIGAVSMPLTSIGVGLLLEQDRLKLDDEIQKYVPAFPKKQWPVTLRQLMGHLSGVRQDNGDEEPLTRCEHAVDGLDRFQHDRLRFQPGTQFRYSMYGWMLVSAAVEAAAGEPFFRYMQEQVFTPLGLSDTAPDRSADPLPNLATFYYPRFAGEPRYGPEPVRSGDYSCMAGAAGFLSTPSDLVRFGMDKKKLLRPETLKLLQTPQRLASGEETGYGLGWNLDAALLAGQSVRQVGHDAEYLLGGAASFIMFPDRGMVVAVTANISFAKLEPLARSLADLFAK